MITLIINDKKYSELFFDLRRKKGMKATEVAQFCNYSRSYICDLEKGRRLPTNDVLIGLLKCFDIDFEKFIKQVNGYLHKIQDALNDLIFLNTQSVVTLCNFIKENENNILNLYVISDEYYILNAIYQFTTKGVVSNKDALSLFNGIEGCVDDIENGDLKATFYLYYGAAHRVNGNFEESKKMFNTALQYVKDEDVLSMIYYHYGMYEEDNMHVLTAHTYNEAAMSIFIKSFNHKRAVYAQMHIANNFVRTKEFCKAKEIYIDMINKSKHNGMSDVNPLCVNNIIWLSLLQSKFDAVKLWLEHKDFDKDSLNGKYMKLMYYMAVNEHDRAVELAMNVILKEKLNENSLMYHKFYCLYLRLEYPEKESTIDYFLESYKMMNRNTDQQTVMIMLDLIIEYYEMTRKYKHALHYCKIKALL